MLGRAAALTAVHADGGKDLERQLRTEKMPGSGREHPPYCAGAGASLRDATRQCKEEERSGRHLVLSRLDNQKFRPLMVVSIMHYPSSY